MADFSRPGSDGALPDGFAEWQRGVTYTVRRELLVPLATGRDYRLNVTLRRRHPSDREFTGYNELYQRVSGIMTARVADVARRNEGRPLYSWILAHIWLRQDLGQHSFVSAAITRGLVVADTDCAQGTPPRRSGIAAPRGEEDPSADALQKPGGQALETFAARHVDDAGQRRLDEIYTEFEMPNAPDVTRDVTISYGEYSVDDHDLDFEPYVRRAERLGAFYLDSVMMKPNADANPLPAVMREWTCLDTGKTTDRRVVTVHLFLRL